VPWNPLRRRKSNCINKPLGILYSRTPIAPEENCFLPYSPFGIKLVHGFPLFTVLDRPKRSTIGVFTLFLSGKSKFFLCWKHQFYWKQWKRVIWLSSEGISWNQRSADRFIPWPTERILTKSRKPETNLQSPAWSKKYPSTRLVRYPTKSLCPYWIETRNRAYTSDSEDNLAHLRYYILGDKAHGE